MHRARLLVVPQTPALQSTKACWRNITVTICSSAQILAAFDKGIHDGVDIFSVSLSGPGDYFESPTSIGAFHAMRKGIVVVASAGNDQVDFGDGSVQNVAPWIITVGASTQDRAFFADVSLGDNRTFKGLSLTIRTPEKRKYPLVSSALAGLPTSNFSASQLCLPGSLDPEKVRGKIVACLDGAVHPVLKSREVLQAGGVGTLVLNSRWDFTTQHPEFAAFPYVQVDAKVTRAVLSYINSTSSPVASIRYRITRRHIKPSPVMAPFSSAGPSAIDPDILKPDITAPGVNILAANTQFENETAFRFMSGTSMSCPHVTGVVALLKSYRPSWSPAALKSAIVTTAYPFDNLQNTIQNSSLSPATPFNYGGGHINPNAAAHPGLIYDAGEQDYIGYLCSIGYNQTQLSIITGTSTKCPDNPSGLNSPSIVISNLWLGKAIYRRVTNVDDDATTYTATVEEPAGFSVSVDPPVLQFERKGESKTFQVRFRAEEVEDNEFHYGKLRWSNGKHTVTSPIAVRQSF